LKEKRGNKKNIIKNKVLFAYYFLKLENHMSVFYEIELWSIGVSVKASKRALCS
jgi:hypothetical protein